MLIGFLSWGQVSKLKALFALVSSQRLQYLHLPVARGAYHSLYIEMKKMDGKLSIEQVDFKDKAEKYGNKVFVCRGWRAAATALYLYLQGGL